MLEEGNSLLIIQINQNNQEIKRKLINMYLQRPAVKQCFIFIINNQQEKKKL